MAILENRTRIASSTADFAKAVLVLLRRFFVLVFIGLSLNLLYSSSPKKLSSITLEITGHFVASGLAVYENGLATVDFITEQLSYFKNLRAENVELKLELSRLKQLQNDIELLHAENVALKKLLIVTPDSEYNYITAKLLTVGVNPFSQTALVAAGSKNGVAIDQIVVSSEGLVGRIIEVSDNYAKIMLVTDPNSRIPVIASSSRERGIIAGDITKTKIIYLQDQHLLQEGETLVTSGDGKIFPPSINVARVTKVNQDEVIAQPVVNLYKTDFVRIYID